MINLGDVASELTIHVVSNKPHSVDNNHQMGSFFARHLQSLNELTAQILGVRSLASKYSAGW